MPVHMLADRAVFEGGDQRGDLRFLHRDGEMVRPEMDQPFHERCLGLEREPCAQGDFPNQRVAHALGEVLLQLRSLGLVGSVTPCPESEGLLDRAPHRIAAQIAPCQRCGGGLVGADLPDQPCARIARQGIAPAIAEAEAVEGDGERGHGVGSCPFLQSGQLTPPGLVPRR